MKNSPMNGTFYKGIARTSQTLVERQELLPGSDITNSNLAQVKVVYPESMTCDILNSNGMLMTSVPIKTKCGLEDNEVWGEIELPSIDSWVIIEFIGGRESMPIITGTIYPYSFSKFQTGQKTVKSDDKAFTLKLLEKIDPKTYRRIFKSGTSIEVQEDGTIVIETPTGTFVQIDETNKKVTVSQKDGSNINKIEMDTAGMKLTDKNGNTVEMGSSSVKINNNLEVLQ